MTTKIEALFDQLVADCRSRDEIEKQATDLYQRVHRLRVSLEQFRRENIRQTSACDQLGSAMSDAVDSVPQRIEALHKTLAVAGVRRADEARTTLLGWADHADRDEDEAEIRDYVLSLLSDVEDDR